MWSIVDHDFTVKTLFPSELHACSEESVQLLQIRKRHEVRRTQMDGSHLSVQAHMHQPQERHTHSLARRQCV